MDRLVKSSDFRQRLTQLTIAIIICGWCFQYGLHLFWDTNSNPLIRISTWLIDRDTDRSKILFTLESIHPFLVLCALASIYRYLKSNAFISSSLFGLLVLVISLILFSISWLNAELRRPNHYDAQEYEMMGCVSDVKASRHRAGISYKLQLEIESHPTLQRVVVTLPQKIMWAMRQQIGNPPVNSLINSIQDQAQAHHIYRKTNDTDLSDAPKNSLLTNQREEKKDLAGYALVTQLFENQPCWKWQVLLKRPRNLANGLNFNYELNLLLQSIHATGRVKAASPIHRVSSSNQNNSMELFQVDSSISGERSGDRTKRTLINSFNHPWVAGLLFGQQPAFSSQQWSLAQQTGTLHLLIVSGLHIGIWLIFVLFAARLLMRITAVISRTISLSGVILSSVALLRVNFFSFSNQLLQRYRPRVRISTRWILITLVFILLLSIFLFIEPSLSVYRSVAMAMVGLWMLVTASPIFRVQMVLLLMTLAILIWPMLLASRGFWLSMVSVLALVMFFNGRRSNHLDGLVLPSWIIFTSLMPLMMYYQLEQGLHQMVANILAVPLVIFFIMPVATIHLFIVFLIIAMSPLVGVESSIDLGSKSNVITVLNDGLLVIFDFISSLMQRLDVVYWQWLLWCSDLSLPRWYSANISLLAGWIGLLVLGWYGANRWLLTAGFFLFSCLLALPNKEISAGVSQLDVGQGQSMIVRTESNALVIDTGPELSERYSTARFVVTPMLQQLGIDRLRMLIISHDDNDHAGDFESIVQQFDVHQIVSGQRLLINDESAAAITSRLSSCHINADWQEIDQNLRLRFFPIDKQWQTNDNNASCVVQLDWYGMRILIPGDIDKQVEKHLVRQYGRRLASDILVVGHHGSGSSTSLLWLRAVSANQYWISHGFNNQFGHPAPAVIDRIQQMFPRAQIMTTANSGAIHLIPDGNIQSQRRF